MQEMQETWVQSLGQEDPLEESMATRSSILAWRIPWTKEPGSLQSMGFQRIGCDWSDLAHMHAHTQTTILAQRRDSWTELSREGIHSLPPITVAVLSNSNGFFNLKMLAFISRSTFWNNWFTIALTVRCWKMDSVWTWFCIFKIHEIKVALNVGFEFCPHWYFNE